MFTRDVSSFDVFGTLLFRRIHAAERRFSMLVGGLGGPRTFVQRRILEEHNLAQAEGPDLYSLDKIYEAVGDGGPAAQDEKDMETRLCFVATQARRFLTAARKGGEPVLFVSDMYLPGEFIRALLEKHGLWRAGDFVYVSHEHGAAKHRGLFQKICRELSLAPSQIRHIGDNLRSDVLIPRKFGVRTTHFRAGDPSRYEIAWAAKGGKEGEAVADAIRAARLQFPEELDGRGQTVWETACGVAGPLFISYVLWLEKQARELGLKRLYFISRDGLIFKKIYDRLFGGQATSPESRYLYGSRQAWSGVRTARLLEEDIAWLTKPGTGLTLEKFAKRCGLAAREVPSLSWSRPPAMEERLSEHHLAELKGFLLSGPLREAVQAAGREARSRASAFLHQEGLGQGRYGLVDLGWFGNLQECVNNLVPENTPAMGFYLDLRGKPQVEREGRACAFLQRPIFQGIDQANSVTLLEILSGSKEGSVATYCQDHGRWKAVEEPVVTTRGPEAWADLQHRAILFLLEEILFQPGGVENLRGEVQAAWENLRQFLKYPSLAEAEAYGEICFVSNQEGGGGLILAPQVGLRETLVFFQKGYWKRQIAWPPAMVVRAKGITRWLLWIRYAVTQAVQLGRSVIAHGSSLRA